MLTPSRFEEQATLKKYKIKNTNEMFRKFQSQSNLLNKQEENTPSDTNACHHCNNIFNAKCKPTKCQHCSSYVHRTCIKDHAKICSTRESRATFNNHDHSSINISSTSNPITPLPIINCDADTNNLTKTSSVLNPSVPPHPPPVTEDASTVRISQDSQSKRSQKGKKQKQDTHDETQNLNLEFLKRELSSAQARIVQLDASIDDKDKKISILRARVNFLEDRDNQATYDKYFSRDNRCQSSQCSTSAPCISSASPSVCMHHSPHCSKPHDRTVLNGEILQQLKDIRNMLNIISSSLILPKSTGDKQSPT